MATALPPNKHQEKSLRTRELLLDATIQSLLDVGYGNASIADIAARAGVTRGAQGHHFHTRMELFAQVIDHLAVRQREALRRYLGGYSSSATAAEVVVGVVGAVFSGPLGRASIELYSAIANDDKLRREMLLVQQELTAEVLETCARLVEPDISRERVESTFWMTIDMLRGITMDEMLGRGQPGRNYVLERWTRLAAIELSGADLGDH